MGYLLGLCAFALFFLSDWNDWKWKRRELRPCFPLGGVLLSCLALAGSPSPLWEALFALAGGLCVSLPLLMLALGGERALGKETMGGGDIKLFFMLGLYFDWKVNLFLLLCACFLGIVFALAARKGKEERIPFGPAIACGAWVAVMVGERAVSAYLGLFAR